MLLQLAQLINEKPQIINEYENGKAIPNPQARPQPARPPGHLHRTADRHAEGLCAPRADIRLCRAVRVQILNKMSRVRGVVLKKNPGKK